MTQLRLLILLALLLAVASPAIAQNTLVSATITDAGGQAWVSGTYTFTSEAYPSIAIISGTLDATGSFTSISFPTNNVTAGVGGRWRARICPAVTAPCYGTSISVPGGSTLSLTSVLVPPAITIDALKPPPVTAYTDSEITNSVQGSRYFNVTDNTEHICKALPCSSNWVSNPSSGANATYTGNNTHSGVETFKNIDNIIFVDGINYANCSAAAAAIGAVNKTILIIPSNASLSDCGTVTENITVFNYNGAIDQCNVLIATPPCSAITFNNDDTVVYSAERHEMTTNHQDANGVSLALYAITTLKSATANGTSGIDGISGEANTAGVLSGTFSALQAHEADVTVRSTGGTITSAVGGVFYYNSDVGATTAVTSVYGLRALGCNTVLGTAPTNCYGAWFARQDAGGVGKASTRNYSFGSEGPGLFLYNSGLGRGGFDMEDASHVTHLAMYSDSSNNLNIQAINAAGTSFLDSGGVTRATLTSAGLKVATGFTPTTAAGIGLGTTALPFSNLIIGTAATNNFTFNPAATGQATTISVLDPKAATAAVSWQGGIPCTNGELALSAGWGTTATVTAVVGLGWSCEWTLTSSGTGQAASPTITDTLVLPVLSASIACEMRMVGGTGTATLIDQTTLSSTAPVFTFGGTPVAASTYKVYRRC